MKFRLITSEFQFSEISPLNNECTGMNELKQYFDINSTFLSKHFLIQTLTILYFKIDHS